MKKVAVILAGCGHLDGSEIREAVVTLLALDRCDAQVMIFAPNRKQHDVVNHITGQTMPESRNILIEAARIARGQISDLKDLKVKDFDALIMPGGFGAAKNLATIAEKGGQGEVIPEVKSIIQEFLNNKKPIGAICISPALVASALQGLTKATLTLGEPNELLTAFGAKEQVCQTTEIAVDTDNKIVSCPAYMIKDRLKNIASGIEQLVKKVIEMA